MNAVPLVIVAVVMSLGMQPAPKPAPPPQPVKPVTLNVEIVVGAQENLAATCKKGGVNPSTVFVVSTKQVFHCIGNSLHDHANHGKDPDLEKAVVRLSAGDRVRWFSTRRFFVASVERHELPGVTPPKKNLAPASPFAAALPKEYRTEVISPPVRDEPGTIVQRYKASFNIEGVGLIDPDLICSM